MPNVLLVIPPGIEPRRARDEALAAAERLDGGLVALVVLDPAETTRIAATLDSAFMGDRVSDRVVEVLARESRGRADEMLAALAAEAGRRGVAFTPLVEEGDPSEVCARVIRARDIALAVVVAEKRSWLSRFLSGGADVRLPALAGCEVKVLEEG